MAANLFLVLLSLVMITANEHAVYEYVLKDYNKNLRPVRDSKNALTVHMAAAVKYLLQVDELNELYSVFQFTALFWKDEFLKWDPEQFQGTEQIQIPARLVWIAPIFITNMIESREVFPEEEEIVTVTSEGHVTVSFMNIYKLKCQFNIMAFPFDKQTCHTEFAIRGFGNEEVGLLFDEEWGGGTMGWIKENPEWDILSYTPHIIERNMTSRNNHNVTVVNTRIQYRMHFARKPTYYMLSIAAPSFTITALCLIGLFTPSSSTGDRTEKVTLGLTTLLAMAVMLQIVTNQMPRSSTGFPLLGSYILYEMLLASVATAITVLVMLLHERAVTRQWRRPKRSNRVMHKRSAHANNLEAFAMHVVNGNDGLAKLLTEQKIMLHKCVDQLQNLNNLYKENMTQESIEENWNKFFDKVDACCLIAFQFINIMLSYFSLSNVFNHP